MKKLIISLFCILLSAGYGVGVFAKTSMTKAEMDNLRADTKVGIDAYKKKDYSTAFQILKPLAEKGNADAQNLMGVMYILGLGTKKDPKTSFELFKASALQGHAVAQRNFGRMYFKGIGVAIDIDEGIRWYHLSAEQGDKTSQNILGNWYKNGKVVPQNYETAIKWYRLAAEQGHSSAQTTLGYMYYSGEAGSVDIKEAIKWYSLAVKQGDSLAMYALGSINEDSQNYEMALSWYKLAAELGYSDAKDAIIEVQKKEEANLVKKGAVETADSTIDPDSTESVITRVLQGGKAKKLSDESILISLYRSLGDKWEEVENVDPAFFGRIELKSNSILKPIIKQIEEQKEREAEQKKRASLRLKIEEREIELNKIRKKFIGKTSQVSLSDYFKYCKGADNFDDVCEGKEVVYTGVIKEVDDDEIEVNIPGRDGVYFIVELDEEMIWEKPYSLHVGRKVKFYGKLEDDGVTQQDVEDGIILELSPIPHESRQAVECKSDWTKCSGVEQFVKSGNSMYGGGYLCKSEAKKLSKYDDTDFPMFSFGRYSVDDKLFKSGQMMRFENNAKFKNGFGVMAPIRLYCHYDFVNMKVLAVGKN